MPPCELGVLERFGFKFRKVRFEIIQFFSHLRSCIFFCQKRLSHCGSFLEYKSIFQDLKKKTTPSTKFLILSSTIIDTFS